MKSEPLTHSEIQSLKRKIDAARRKQIDVERTLFGGIYVCSGCGMNLFDRTPGCVVCSNRWGRWRKNRTGVATEREYDLADRLTEHWTDQRFDNRRRGIAAALASNGSGNRGNPPESYRRSMRYTVGKRGYGY